MRKSLLLYSFLFLLLFKNSNAQVTQEWVASYNGTGNGDDRAVAIVVDGSGNIYTTGFSAGSGTGNDFVTIKYNSSGVMQWLARYSSPGTVSDFAKAITIDPESSGGNVYVTGYGYTTSSDYVTIKYNSAGVQQWVAVYNGPAGQSDVANSIAADHSGNVYVTGYSPGSGTNNDFATVMYNSSGVQQWVARYNGPGNLSDVANSIAVDNSGNAYVTGSAYGGAGSGNDFTVVKYNSSGAQQWVSIYLLGTRNGPDAGNKIAVDASENVYAAGYSFRNGSDNDYLTIKYSASGEVLWVRRYNGPGYNDDQAQSLMLDGSGNVYVTGWSIAAGIGVNYDYAAVKYDSSGTQEWVARYDGPGGYDYAYSAALDSSGNVYVTGMSVDLVTNYDYATVKFNSSGIQQWVMRYSGQGFYWDEAHSVAVDGSGNVFVTGNVYNGSSLNDYTTIKYSQFVGITPVSNETPSEFRLYQNYPNPFNPTTLIKFDVAQFPLNKGGERGLFAELKIYDVLGGEIATIVNKQLNPGTYEIEWDGTNFPSGVYYYRLTAAEFTETRRMVLAK